MEGLNRIRSERNPGDVDDPIAVFVPLDGFHLSRAQLSDMPDPTTAHARRGAAFTFDSKSFLNLVRALQEPVTSKCETIYAPSFDHAVKDPVQNDILIRPSARIVLFEGNYLSLNQGDWKLAAALMDELWFMEVDFAVARRRLIARHIKAGIANDETEAAKRADENDLVNGRQIQNAKLAVHETIESVEDSEWLPLRSI